MSDFNYKQYLASREWALKREAVRERSKGRCERCFHRKMEAVHHKTYERIGREILDDLQAICNLCHEFESGKLQYDPALYYYRLPEKFAPSRLSSYQIIYHEVADELIDQKKSHESYLRHRFKISETMKTAILPMVATVVLRGGGTEEWCPFEGTVWILDEGRGFFGCSFLPLTYFTEFWVDRNESTGQLKQHCEFVHNAIHQNIIIE